MLAGKAAEERTRRPWFYRRRFAGECANSQFPPQSVNSVDKLQARMQHAGEAIELVVSRLWKISNWAERLGL